MLEWFEIRELLISGEYEVSIETMLYWFDNAYKEKEVNYEV